MPTTAHLKGRAPISQINFYMTEDDERAFFEMLASRGDTRCVGGRYHTTSIPPYVERYDELPGHELVELVNPTLVDPVVMSPCGSGEFEGMYAFDSYRDPHIEWSRCWQAEGFVGGGRLFTKIGWAEGDQRAYQRWYDALCRWIRSRYTRHTPGSCWIGPDAATRRRAPLGWSRDVVLTRLSDSSWSAERIHTLAQGNDAWRASTDR